jgi:hypothetical protein
MVVKEPIMIEVRNLLLIVFILKPYTIWGNIPTNNIYA